MNEVIIKILSGVTYLSFIVIVISSIAIQLHVHEKRKNEIPFMFFALNAMILYPEITKKENGKIGKWFYTFIIGFSCFMLSIIGTVVSL